MEPRKELTVIVDQFGDNLSFGTCRTCSVCNKVLVDGECADCVEVRFPTLRQVRQDNYVEQLLKALETGTPHPVPYDDETRMIGQIIKACWGMGHAVIPPIEEDPLYRRLKGEVRPDHAGRN
jgi:hypothetical protein